MKGFNGDSKTKLVPIDRAAAFDCAKEGARTGAGYYKTVNDRVKNYPQVIEFLRAMCAAFPGLIDGEDDVNGGDLVDWLSCRLTDTETGLGAMCAPVWNTARLMVCADCFDVVAGNTDNIDADREGEIEVALGDLSGTVSPGDADNAQEFSWHACELCRSKLGGARHEIINLTRGGTI